MSIILNSAKGEKLLVIDGYSIDQADRDRMALEIKLGRYINIAKITQNPRRASATFTLICVVTSTELLPTME